MVTRVPPTMDGQAQVNLTRNAQRLAMISHSARNYHRAVTTVKSTRLTSL